MNVNIETHFEIYQVENTYDVYESQIVVYTTSNKQKAQDIIKELEKENLLIEQKYIKCNNCPIYSGKLNLTSKNLEIKRHKILKYCDCFKEYTINSCVGFLASCITYFNEDDSYILKTIIVEK